MGLDEAIGSPAPYLLNLSPFPFRGCMILEEENSGSSFMIFGLHPIRKTESCHRRDIAVKGCQEALKFHDVS